MTREDIIAMAREKANSILFDLIGKPEWDKGCTEQHLIDFAALVAAKERNRTWTQEHWPEQHSEDGDAKEYKLVPLYATPPAQEFVCSAGLCHYKANKEKNT